MSEYEFPEGGLKSLDELQEAQYIRAEYLNPVFRAKVTLNYTNLVFNASCVKLLADTEYINLLVLPTTRRLVVEPCGEHAKDAARWSETKGAKLKPRYIPAKVACGQLFKLMNWNITYRYKIMAVYQEIEQQRLIVFNLVECEMYIPEETEGASETTRTKRRKVYPIDWKNTFGTPYAEHKDTYTVELDKMYLLTSAKSEKHQIDARVPTASEIITRQYYVPDEIKKGGDR
jgi:hypothetical protein